MMSHLTKTDVQYVLRRTPKDVRAMMRENPGKLFMGGGFIRETIAGAPPSDIDLFGTSKDHVDALAALFAERRKTSKPHKTNNAITVASPTRLPVQFIRRWTFDQADALVASFDFTVCQAAIWWMPDGWKSAAGDGFYADLAARRLVYTAPVREEEPGGSMMRAVKFLRRGYVMQADSIAGVVDRLMSGVQDRGGFADVNRAAVITGLLREVDPLLVVDGIEVVDEHSPLDEEDNQ